jgi:uncharacterized membrane protein
MSSGRIAQHRNYGDIMERHERDVRIRRVVKAFIFFLIILALLILFVIVSRLEQKETPGKAVTAHHSINKAAPAEIHEVGMPLKF